MKIKPFKHFSTLIIIFSLCFSPALTQDTELFYLSGSGNDDTRDWEFFCTGGQNSGKWTTIPVPSNWELQGFGTYNYGHDMPKADEQGLYKHTFFAHPDWKGKTIKIVFEGVMTDTEVKINGKPAGPVHQGGFYRFSYDITSLIRPGKNNLLEVNVSKVSSDESINMAERKADYWVFGGIYRPVYLRILPPEYIDRVAIDAGHKGNFHMDVYTEKLKRADKIRASVTDMEGIPISPPFETAIIKDTDHQSVKINFQSITPWNPEKPVLYKVKTELLQGQVVIHTATETFGFRTVEFRKRDGIYINDTKVIMKGANRHSFWPSSGRTTSKALSIKDVNLMKDMNMNAVRMSHYPPDKHFLEVCDSLGLFVLNELAGWQLPPYDTEIGKKLVKEFVTRDVNHPSVIFWQNGNEGGWNTELDGEFHKYDPQKRKVLHPQAVFEGADLAHYRPYGYGTSTFFNGREVFFPTEFLHGLYDGGHGAGLEDYWHLLRRNPLGAGGFLWVFSDEGVVRTDKNGIIDTDGNHAPDGILGPYREKEGSFYTIRQIWSPIHIYMNVLPELFNGKVKIRNDYHFTNLAECKFQVSILEVDIKGSFKERVVESYRIDSPSLLPEESGYLDFKLPEGWRKHDILALEAYDPIGRQVMRWTWNIKTPFETAEAFPLTTSKSEAVYIENDTHFTLMAKGIRVMISKKTGLLDSAFRDNRYIPFCNGPLLSPLDFESESTSCSSHDGKVIVKVKPRKGFHILNWILHPSGWLELDYTYNLKGSFDFAGIHFSYPENKVSAVHLLANGPYRVWQNRMKGPWFGLHYKKYNNTVTGESWDYPEFKGYYSGLHYARFETTDGPFTVLSRSEDIFLRLFTPEPPSGAGNNNTSPPFPTGDISFLHAIPGIGTKFLLSENLGPQGQKSIFNAPRNTSVKSGNLWFYFGKE